MKVLFIAGADQQYGTFQMSKLLLETVKKIDNDIQFVVVTQKYGPLNIWCQENDIENITLPYRYCVYYPSTNPIKALIKHAIKKALVTTCNLIALHNLERTGILQDIDIIHTNNNRDLFGIIISEKHKVPNVTYLREFSRAHFGLKPLYKNQIDMMNDNSERFIAISKSVEKDWIEYGISNEKTVVVYDGLNVEKYHEKLSSREKEAPLRIVMCGAIYEGKGQKELLEAVAPLINDGLNIYVDLYGKAASQSYYQEIVNYIAECDIKTNIRLLGYENNLAEVLSQYDVGVICSKAEGFGLATVEFMLSGLLIVASDKGANPEILEQGKCGVIYPLGDVDKLRRIIERIYDKDIVFPSGEVADYGRQKYSIDNTAKAVCDIYAAIGEMCRK